MQRVENPVERFHIHVTLRTFRNFWTTFRIFRICGGCWVYFVFLCRIWRVCPRAVGARRGIACCSDFRRRGNAAPATIGFSVPATAVATDLPLGPQTAVLTKVERANPPFCFGAAPNAAPPGQLAYCCCHCFGVLGTLLLLTLSGDGGRGVVRPKWRACLRGYWLVVPSSTLVGRLLGSSSAGSSS